MRHIVWLILCCTCGARGNPTELVRREPVGQAATPNEPLMQIAAPPTEPTGIAASCGSGWSLELLPPAPPVGLDQIRVRSGGAWRVVTMANPVPNAPAKHFDRPITEDLSAVDADGTVVFTGYWDGNPDQTNNVGTGIYQLAGDRVVPLVDPSTVMPDTGQRVNFVGLPNIEDGKVAFYGGRDDPGQSGVYLYHDHKITPIAGAKDTIHGTGTPSMSGGSIAFQAEQDGVAGIYLWTPQRGVVRAFRMGDLGIALLDWVALGAGVVFVGAGMSLDDHREIVAWAGGEPWVIAAGAEFRDRNGAAMYLATLPVAHGTHVAFTVGLDHYTEAWVADARAGATCKRERVAATGDVLGTSRIAMVSGLSRDAFTADGHLLLSVVLDNQQVRLVRATRR